MRKRKWMSAACLLLSAAVCTILLTYEPEAGQANAVPQPSPESAQPESSAVHLESWRLLVVNKQHPLPDGFTVACEQIAEGQYADKRVAPYLNKMLTHAREDGCPLVVVSSYRSLQRQQQLYNQTLSSHLAAGLDEQQAVEQTLAYQAPPGTSEHATGLAFDIVNVGWYTNHSDLTDDFDQTPAYAWLQKHAAEYGFIERYPREKVAVTGYSYEPWHWRYVGGKAAAEMSQTGQCLEEYTGING